MWQFISQLSRYHRISPLVSETIFFPPTVSKQLYTLIRRNPVEKDVAVDGISTNLMDVMRLLMESETVLE